VVEVVGDLARFAGTYKTGGACVARPFPISAGVSIDRPRRIGRRGDGATGRRSIVQDARELPVALGGKVDEGIGPSPNGKRSKRHTRGRRSLPGAPLRCRTRKKGRGSTAELPRSRPRASR
jgi:hypothetical protein